MSKTKAKKEEMIKVCYVFPATLKRKLSEMALSERRSINAQLIVLLETAIEQATKTETA